MKIHEYNEMMAHLTRRRPMSNGGRAGNIIYNSKVQQEIKRLYDQGLSLNEIVDKTNYSRSTVKRVKNILGLETIFEKNKNTVENAIEKLKKEKGRNPTLAEMIRETGLNEKTINRNKGNVVFAEGRTVGEFKGAGTAEATRLFKEKKVDKPTATNFDGKPGVKFKDKTQEKKYLEILEKKYDYPVNSPEIKEINKKLMKDFGINKFSLERINATLAKQEGFEFPKKVFDPETERGRQRIRERKRAEALRKTSDPSVERQIQKAIKSVDPKALAKEVDVAHRASLIANARLGSDYLATSLGIDKKIVNQKLVKPTEQKLGKLYEDQQKLIKELKPGEVPKEVQKKIEKLNIKISELSDRTKGALQGVLVDEKTLKPSIYGIDYKKVFGAGLIDDVPVKDLSPEQIELAKLNIPEQIKAAKKSGTTLGSTMIQPELANLDTPAARNLFRGAGRIALGETFFAPASVVLDTYAGLTPAEMALNVATFGAGVPLKDSVQKRKYIADAGFGKDYSSALQKRRIAKTAPKRLVGELTEREQQAMFLSNAFDEGLRLKREEQAEAYKQRQQSQLKKGELEVPDTADVPEEIPSIQPEFQEETTETRSLPFGLDRLLPFDDEDEII